MTQRVAVGALAAVLLSFAGVATAANLAVNGSFAGDLSGWNAGSSTFDATQDATGVPGSGSAQNIFAASGASTLLAIDQCISGIVPGASYTFGGKVFMPNGQNVAGTGFVTISWFSGTNCTTGFISAANVSTTTTGSFISLASAPQTAPLNAQRVWLTGQNAANGAGSHQVNYDDMFIDGPAAPTPSPTPGPGPAAVVETLSWPMLAFFGLALAAAAVLLMNRR